MSKKGTSTRHAFHRGDAVKCIDPQCQMEDHLGEVSHMQVIPNEGKFAVVDWFNGSLGRTTVKPKYLELVTDD